MRVCYFGTYDRDYSRNRILIDGLRSNGVEVIECHKPLWAGTSDKVARASGGWRSPRFLAQFASTYVALIRQLWALRGQFDVLVLGYAGLLDVYPARLLASMLRVPLVWDAYMSVHLISSERKIGRLSPMTLSLIKRAEKLSCQLADGLIIETEASAEYFEQTYGVAPSRFCPIPTGADERIFFPQSGPRIDDRLHVLYYGSYIPQHGVQTIVEAANLLRDHADITFEFIGKGPDRQAAIDLADGYGLANVVFEEWIARVDLPLYIARADVCLGVFGSTGQSLRTIHNKIYEALACARPVVTGLSPTVVEVITHGYHAYLVGRDDPTALAGAILTLRDDPELRQRLAENGYALFQQRFTHKAVGATMAQYLQDVLTQHTRRKAP